MNDCSSEQPSIPNGIRNDEDNPISVESKSQMAFQAHRRVCVLTCFAATNHAEPNVTAIRPSCDPFVEGVGTSEGPRAADPKESLDEPESMDVDCSGGGSLEYFGSPCTDGEEMLAGSHLSGEEFFRCQWTDCTRGFPLLEELITHVNDDHVKLEKETDYSCRWKGCTRRGKAFNARYKMLIHVRTHTNEKPHRCCECGKSFSRLENLKIHNRSHTGEKPYICPMVGCNKAYSNSSDRFKHTRTHYVDKPYACKKEGCDKRYTDPSSLRKHMKTYGHYGDGRDVLALASRSSGDCQRGSAGNVVVSDRTMDGSAVDEHRRLVKCLTKIQQDLVRTSSSLFTVSVASAMMADSVKNCDDVTANGGRCDGALNSVPRKAPDGRSSIGPRSSDKCRDDKYQSNPLDLTIGHPENVS